MPRLNINRLTNENEDGSPAVSGISTFSSTAFLEPPKGTTAQRPSDNLQGGMMRFNTDSGHLEYFDGNQWTDILVANNSLDGGNRGVFGGGYVTPAGVNTIDFITISTIGNAIDFGDLIVGTNSGSAACSSSTRGVFGGGNAPSTTNSIEYITIASTGNAQDFGDRTNAVRNPAGCSDSTRGLFAGGFSNTNVIDFITISTLGDAVDFGDLTIARRNATAFSSSTRGIFAAGLVSPVRQNVIEYITIASTGNALDFGDLTETKDTAGGCSNSTRGLIGGGTITVTPATVISNVINYITIASLGDASTFGNLTESKSSVIACSSSTRGAFGGGATPTIVNTIEYVTILTTGNSSDFGDLTIARSNLSALSNGHGGL